MGTWLAGRLDGEGAPLIIVFFCGCGKTDVVVSPVNISTQQWEVAVAPEGCTKQCVGEVKRWSGLPASFYFLCLSPLSGCYNGEEDGVGPNQGPSRVEG